jgi:thymidylate kinase
MTTHSKGKLFVFEGPDGVGKTTLSRSVFDSLEKTRGDFIFASFPGKDQGTLGGVVYDLHHWPEKFKVKDVNPVSMQILHAAAHVDAIKNVIEPTILSGKNVILDRYWWSILVYGAVGGIEMPVLKKIVLLESRFWRNLIPEAVFLICRDAPLDRDVDMDNWTDLAKRYEDLAELERRKYPVHKIKNDSSIEDALSIIEETILSELNLSDAAIVPVRAAKKGVQPAIDFGLEMTANAPVSYPGLLPLKVSVVYDTFWKFAVKRQEVFFNRLEGKPAPWTDDPVLLNHKFTNAYRASDRVSQYLIRHVIYNPEYSSEPEDVFFRIMLFKFFNRIETWQLIAGNLVVDASENFDFQRCDELLTARMAGGNSIYSAAYIMPSGGKNFGMSAKHRMHLKLLEIMRSDKVHKWIAQAPKMSKAFDILRAYPTIGDFLAYQFVTDINYSEITNFDEMDFVVPGPGARDGIRKCFLNRGGLSEAELIRFIAERQEEEFDRLGLKFRDLWGRPLQLIDCQNLFCEVDKYARVVHPTVAGISGRTRIKQSYKSNSKPIDYWYPPKWRINDRIPHEKR